MRIIGEMVGNTSLPEQYKDAMTQLAEEKERLQGLLKAIRDRMNNKFKSYILRHQRLFIWCDGLIIPFTEIIPIVIFDTIRKAGMVNFYD